MALETFCVTLSAFMQCFIESLICHSVELDPVSSQSLQKSKQNLFRCEFTRSHTLRKLLHRHIAYFLFQICRHGRIYFLHCNGNQTFLQIGLLSKALLQPNSSQEKYKQRHGAQEQRQKSEGKLGPDFHFLYIIYLERLYFIKIEQEDIDQAAVSQA